MTYKYSASYEFLEDPPETVRGELQSNQHHLAFKDAMKILRRAHPKRKPSSIVICLEVVK